MKKERKRGGVKEGKKENIHLFIYFKNILPEITYLSNNPIVHTSTGCSCLRYSKFLIEYQSKILVYLSSYTARIFHINFVANCSFEQFICGCFPAPGKPIQAFSVRVGRAREKKGEGRAPKKGKEILFFVTPP